MGTEWTADLTDSAQHDAAALRALVNAQAAEIERLRALHAADAAPASRRRDLLKGVGLVGGLAALGAVSGVQAPTARAAQERTDQRGQEPVYLALRINGQAVAGESSQSSLGRENMIECLYYKHAVSTAREAGSGLATGRRQHEPITIRKRIDKASPLLLRALAQNQVVEGRFLFFRPNPSGDGTTEQFYSVEFKQGRVASLEQYVPELTGDGTATPPLEEVAFVFGTISVTYANGGVTFEDSVSGGR